MHHLLHNVCQFHISAPPHEELSAAESQTRQRLSPARQRPANNGPIKEASPSDLPVRTPRRARGGLEKLIRADAWNIWRCCGDRCGGTLAIMTNKYSINHRLYLKNLQISFNQKSLNFNPEMMERAETEFYFRKRARGAATSTLSLPNGAAFYIRPPQAHI